MARSGINKVILVGNLGNDPEVRYMPNGNAVANISIATSESWQDKQTGEQRETTEWHRVVFYRRLAEIVGEYLKKGSKVYVEGRLQTRKWQGQDGQDRYTTEIIANEMQMLDSRRSGGTADFGGTQDNFPSPQQPQQVQQAQPQQSQTQPPAQSQTPQQPSEGVVDDFDDDIPF